MCFFRLWVCLVENWLGLLQEMNEWNEFISSWNVLVVIVIVILAFKKRKKIWFAFLFIRFDALGCLASWNNYENVGSR